MVGLTKRADNFSARNSIHSAKQIKQSSFTCSRFTKQNAEFTLVYLKACVGTIARALAKNPRLLLCDEPTGALDYVTGKAVLKMLYELSRKQGTYFCADNIMIKYPCINGTFIICIGHSALNNSRIGSGSLEGFIYINPECFKSEYFTEMYLTLRETATA